MTPDRHALIAYLESREDWRFGYGREAMTHDCARFAGAGVRAVWGRDPLADFAGSWTTRAGARRVLSRHGGMAAAVSTVMRPISPLMAARGDVGMTEGGQLVLFEGDGVVGLTDTTGYRRLPRSAAIAAWTL